MNTASIIFLIVLFGGFITTVVVVFKKRKKFWGKAKDAPYYVDGPDASGDISIEHPYGSADCGSGDGGGDH